MRWLRRWMVTSRQTYNKKFGQYESGSTIFSTIVRPATTSKYMYINRGTMKIELPTTSGLGEDDNREDEEACVKRSA